MCKKESHSRSSHAGRRVAIPVKKNKKKEIRKKRNKSGGCQKVTAVRAE
jgi:hypothetical protein